MAMRAALLQLNSSDDPEVNLAITLGMMDTAIAQGAEFILTPEVTNCVSGSRAHQNTVLHPEESDPTLAGLRARSQVAAHQYTCSLPFGLKLFMPVVWCFLCS